MLARDEWQVLLLDAHPGYISSQHHENNQMRLAESALAHGGDRRHGVPREGPALLHGLAICGLRGIRMAVRYHDRRGALVPEYTCHIRTMEHREPPCQRIPGGVIDAAVGRHLIELMTPMAIELSLAVQDEIQTRMEETDELRKKQVQRAQYEVDLARSRYMQVDPSRRLVIDSQEADWNGRIRELNTAREERKRGRQWDQASLDELQRVRIRKLAEDFPALWNDPATPHRERKRVAALLIEDATLIKKDAITVHVRFRGGRSETLTLPIPPNAWQKRQTRSDVVAAADRLLAEHTDGEVAALLNERGMTTGAGQPFTSVSVSWLRNAAGLKSLKERQRGRGMLTTEETARRLGISITTVKEWRAQGLLNARPCDDKGTWLFEPWDRESLDRALESRRGRHRPQTRASDDSPA